MRDRATEGPGLGPLGIDVDPLVVSGRVREQIHLLLGHGAVLAVAEVCADERVNSSMLFTCVVIETSRVKL